MSTFQIGAITIPAGADTTDALAALQQYYANNGVPAPTQAQILEYMRQEIIAKITNLTKQYRQAQASVATPGIT
jgi:hypothetical protein